MLNDLVAGFMLFFHWGSLTALVFGTASGIIIGAMPGLGPTMAIAVLTPLTFSMDALTAIVFLLGIYVGGVYGGSISAILINTPGTPASAATLLDGYPLARQGKAKKALKMALYASVFGNVFGVIVLIVVSAQMARIALKFGPPEYASLILFSLTIIGSLTGKSVVKGLISGAFGVLLSTIGADPIDGTPRLLFGLREMGDGLDVVVMLIGLFAVAEVLLQAEKKSSELQTVATVHYSPRREDNRVSWHEFRSVLKSMLRSSGIGAFIGALPGLGQSTAAFLCYGFALRSSKNQEEFGKGSLDGVAAAESGNNAVNPATLIPLLALSIPGDPTGAVLLGALVIHGLTPGPLLFQTHGDVIYGIFASIAFCSLVLLVLGMLSFKLFGYLTSLPRYGIYPVVVVLCAVGSYAMKNSVFDVYVMLFFAVVGYAMVKGGFPPAPLVLGFILGPMLENRLRQALVMSEGSFIIFVSRPISLFFVILTAVSLSLIIWGKMRKKS